MVRLCTLALTLAFSAITLSQTTPARTRQKPHSSSASSSSSTPSASRTVSGHPIHSTHPVVHPVAHARAAAPARKASPARHTTYAPFVLPDLKSSPAQPSPARPAALVRSTPARPAPVQSAVDLANVPVSESPVLKLSGSARALVIFGPSWSSPASRTQMLYLERHQMELTDRDTVVVPVLGARPEDAGFAGENLPSDTPRQQAATRKLLHIAPDQFAVVYLGLDGQESFRSLLPLSITELKERIDEADPGALRSSGKKK